MIDALDNKISFLTERFGCAKFNFSNLKFVMNISDEVQL